MRAKNIAIVLAPRASAFADSNSAEHDTAALSLALELAAQSGAQTTAMTVTGPLQSPQVCEEALRLGCDKAICVRSPTPVDFLSSATLLAHLLRQRMPELIVCGNHYSLNDNAAVAGALARLLDLPLVTGVITAKNNSKGLWARTRSDLGQEEQQCPLPLVLAALQTDESVAPTEHPRVKAKVEEVFADMLLEDASVLRARTSAVGYSDFSPDTAGVELISEPAELLSRLLKEKLWTP